jgi:hypothetical protein
MNQLKTWKTKNNETKINTKRILRKEPKSKIASKYKRYQNRKQANNLQRLYKICNPRAMLMWVVVPKHRGVTHPKEMHPR